jgi:hypothetical protein
MKSLKSLAGVAIAFGLVLGAAPAFAQNFGGPCTREELQKSVDEYLAAQAEGDQTKIHSGLWLTYVQNGEDASFLTGIIGKPLKIDFHRTILDTQACKSFTEAVITDPAHPYVLGVTISSRGGSASNIDMLVTDHDKGWLFNAANTKAYSEAENWAPLPPDQRPTREQLIKAADAYLDLFNDKTVQVPWGSPCERLEGGIYTGKGGGPGKTAPEDSCNVGVPSGVKIVDRNYVVDPELGAVSVRVTFGNNGLADAHTFRLEGGKLRYVHTITVCKTFNCGFKIPDKLPSQAAAR